MTLIVSQVCSRFAIQVSDRLVSSVRAGTVRTFDPASNKTVVFQARDGIASLSYTGLSYIGEKPTDTWLAELLLGHPMPEFAPGTPATMLLGRREGPWHFMGPAIKKIAEGLTAAARQDSELLRSPVIVVVAGWQWYRANKKRPRPFFGGIQQSSVGTYAVQYSPRLHGYRFTAMPVPSAYLEPHEREPFLQKLKPLDPDNSLKELVGTIRMVARRTQTVGEDCMSVYISHPFASDRQVRIQYVSQTPYASLRKGNEVAEAPVAYGPWLLGRSTVVAPSLLVGSGDAQYRLGPYPVTLQGSPPGTLPFGLAMLNTSQTRPRRP